MIDFSNCKVKVYKLYGGASSKKICVNYNNLDYVLKFSSKDKNGQYINSCVSEHISSCILKTLGFNVQETHLGVYVLKNKKRKVVACRDFTTSVLKFKQFAELKNSQINLAKSGYDTELSDVLKTIDNQVIYDKKKLKNFFWEMFIGDSLIGNTNRGNKAWGFLVDEITEKVEIAPIFGSDSSLYHDLTDDLMYKYLNDKTILELYLYSITASALKINGERINYFDFISCLDNVDLNRALLKIFPRIDLEKINGIIDSVDIISDVRKEFYKKIIKMRYEKILKFSYDKLVNKSEI